MPRKAKKGIPNEWLLLALKQAAYIHRRDEIAHEIIKEALSRLTVRSAKQRKRLFAKTNHPARIYLKDLHLFQHLVLLFSERYERSQEVAAPTSVTELDLIVRYIAYIVRKSLRRNSLYGVTGISRFICRYELSDVRRIHEVLIDDPDRFKTDDDFRNYRKKMRDMIFERFSRYLRVENSQKGKEKHFCLRENQNDLALWQLIAKSLDSFMPWKTKCLPSDFNLNDEGQTVFSYHDEHLCEIERLHALIHQDCFRILTRALGCAEPSSRLGIPQFFFNSSSANSFPDLANYNEGPRGDNCGTAHATLDALEAIRTMSLDEAERLVRVAPKSSLSIKLDGREVARLKLAKANQVRFVINDETAELIELVDEKEQLVLAAHLLEDENWQSPKRECSYVVRHAHGPRIVFNFRQLARPDAFDKQLLVVVTYQKALLAQSWFFFKQRTATWFSALKLGLEAWIRGLFPSEMQAPALSPKRVPLVSVSLAMVVGLALLILSQRPNTQSLSSDANTIEPSASTRPVYSKSGEPKTLAKTIPTNFRKSSSSGNQYPTKFRACTFW